MKESDKQNEPQKVPVLQHDDGIYSHPNELIYGARHIVDSALEVIQTYRELECNKVRNLKKPLMSIPGVPDKVLLK